MMTEVTLHRLAGRTASYHHRCATFVAALVLAATIVGCGEEEKKGPPPTFPFDIEVSVVDENDNGVAGAPIELDGKTVGYTDREGLFEGVLTERRGAEIELSVGSMDDYDIPEEARTAEKLRLKKSLDDKVESVPVTMQAEITSRRTSYLVWIEVECDKYLSEDDRCEEMPVLVDGEEYARTDSRGGAHFLINEVPEETVEIAIETPEPPEDDDDDDAFTIEPEDPTYEVELGLEPEVLVIRERFTDPKAKEEAEKPDPPPQPRPKPKPKPKPSDSGDSGDDKKKDDGPIELF